MEIMKVDKKYILTIDKDEFNFLLDLFSIDKGSAVESYVTIDGRDYWYLKKKLPTDEEALKKFKNIRYHISKQLLWGR